MQTNFFKDQKEWQKIKLLCLRKWLGRIVDLFVLSPLVIFDHQADERQAQEKEKAKKVLKNVYREIMVSYKMKLD